MPNTYLTKLSKETGQDIESLESKWKQAVELASKADKGDNYAYITSIFKSIAKIEESVLTEGIIKKLVDWTTAIRIIRMLVLPWKSQNVYTLGLVDENGNILKKPTTDDEKSEMTPLVRLTLKLKRLFDKLPAGSQIASLAAGYAMIKEEIEQQGIDTNILDEMYNAYYQDVLIEKEVKLNIYKYNKNTGYWVVVRDVTDETKDKWLKIYKDDEPNEYFVISKSKPKTNPLKEDAPVNVSGGVAGYDAPMKPARNNWKGLDSVANATVFEVDEDTFTSHIQPRVKGSSWDHLPDNEQNNKIKQFAKTYPTKSIILKHPSMDTYRWLKK